mgnify:FL=1
MAAAPDLLPDSRAKVTRGRVFCGAQSWVPVFCANCGTDGGLCPEENMTFMFYLCNSCVGTHGEVAGTLMMPDQAFWQRVADAQMDEFGRYLNEAELSKVVEDASTPLSRLILGG